MKRMLLGLSKHKQRRERHWKRTWWIVSQEASYLIPTPRRKKTANEEEIDVDRRRPLLNQLLERGEAGQPNHSYL